VHRTLSLATFARQAWILAVVSLGSSRAVGDVYYWDTNGATAGLGSATSPVSWLTNSWATGSGGGLPTGAWPNSTPSNADEANFAGVAGTVTVGADVYANVLRFQTNGYVVSSTGGAVHLDGANPKINVSLPAGNNIATISAPLLGTSGFTLEGNSLAGGLKFLVLANSNGAVPNAFGGTLTIAASGALRLGGGANEQIPDAVDLSVSGVIDFITSGGASDGKQERVRNVAVSGANANFSVGNEATFVVNSITAATTTGPAIALNGNNGNAPNAPCRLVIDGWSDGSGDLLLSDGRVRLNTTSAASAVGSRVLLSGDINSTGVSSVTNVNGGGGSPATNNFTHKGFDFTGDLHTIDVANGTLTFTSAGPARPLEITSTNSGGTRLTKTGAGVWLFEHAVQTSFEGVNRLEEGIWRLGASERLANGSQFEAAGGVFDLQGFSETVAHVVLAGGSISGTSAGALHATAGFQAESGVAAIALGGAASLVKSTAGTVQLNGANTFTGTTMISGGVLLMGGSHVGGGDYTVNAGGMLGGTGVIGDATDAVDVFVTGGNLAPGAGVGTLTVEGGVKFDALSHFKIELQGATADKLIANALSITAGSVLDVTALGAVTTGARVIAEYDVGMLTGIFALNAPVGYSVSYATPGQIILNVPATAIPGDFNGNGVVNAADLTKWRIDYGGPGSDADGDGDSDGNDFLIWQRNLGAGGQATAASSAVPEPSMLAPAALAWVAATTIHRRGKRRAQLPDGAQDTANGRGAIPRPARIDSNYGFRGVA
jgi:autotransporter-associated beta strand protein